VWFDEVGPCAAVGLTDWGGTVQGDALVVPGTVDLEVVWSSLVEAAARLEAPSLEVLAREDDPDLLVLLDAAGFHATEDRSRITWMDAPDRPALSSVPEGFRVADRASRPNRPHPLAARNGDEVEDRLRQCSLYDPELDLAIDTPDGDPAGYALFWFDDVTSVGMLEPMRIEDRHRRQGLARALLTVGLDRLFRRGARRSKVGFDGDAGRHLYEGAGFVVTSTLRSFRR